MLILLWQKGDKSGTVGGKTSSVSSWAWRHSAHLVAFEWYSRKKWGRIFKLLEIFSCCLPMLKRKKKSSANVFSLGGGGGQAIHIQGFPQRAKWMVLNLQINEKHSPGNWKRVIRRQTVVHKYKWDISTQEVQHHETNMISITTPEQDWEFG